MIDGIFAGRKSLRRREACGAAKRATQRLNQLDESSKAVSL
jgi:hypothetical protein